MTETVNLRQARKRAERAKRETEASANRAKHGLTKVERERQRAESERAGKALDQVKRDD
jgi:hypothetical protein